MPRYYFNVYDGIGSVDTDGIDLIDLGAAQTKAIKYASELLKDNAQALIDGEDWHLEVTDKLGLVLFRLDVCTTTAPASRRDPLTMHTPIVAPRSEREAI